MTCGIAAALFITGAAWGFVRLHLLPTGVRPGADTVGHYGLTGYRTHFRLMVLRLGVGCSLLAAGLAARTGAGGLHWLWVYAASVVPMAGFSPDRDPSSRSVRGRFHLLLSVTACAAIALAATEVTWTGAPPTLRVAGYAVAAAAIAALVTRTVRPLRGFLGVGERAVCVTSAAWLLVAAVGLAASS